MGFFDRRGLPTQLASEIPKKERVMAWAQGPERLDGEPTIVVTTDRAMYAHAPSESGAEVTAKNVRQKKA